MKPVLGIIVFMSILWVGIYMFIFWAIVFAIRLALLIVSLGKLSHLIWSEHNEHNS